MAARERIFCFADAWGFASLGPGIPQSYSAAYRKYSQEMKKILADLAKKSKPKKDKA